jgi:hypothetical protein
MMLFVSWMVVIDSGGDLGLIGGKSAFDIGATYVEDLSEGSISLFLRSR